MTIEINTNNKIILSHPTGNQNSREVAKAFNESNKLDCFVTALHIPSTKIPWSWFSHKILNELKRRDFSEVSDKILSASYIREFIRLISNRFGFGFFIKNESSIASVDRIYSKVDKKVSKLIASKNIQAVYAYEDGALETFKVAKTKSIKCIYELPIGYWRAHFSYNLDECTLNPKWSKSWQATKDSKQKLLKKDNELEMSDLIIVASSFTKKTLEDYPDKLPRITVIPYGFPKAINNTDREWFDGKNSLKILYVGGLSQRKGLSYMLKALSEITSSYKFTVIGSGKALTLMQKQLPSLDYMGTMPHHEVLEQMRNHDVLLFPSLFEGFGMVITEAMSQGMVVIATDRTALPDVADDKSGIIVPAGDSKAIQLAIESLLNNKQKVKLMGMAAIKRAKQYQWSDYRAKIAEII